MTYFDYQVAVFGSRRLYLDPGSLYLDPGGCIWTQEAISRVLEDLLVASWLYYGLLVASWLYYGLLAVRGLLAVLRPPGYLYLYSGTADVSPSTGTHPTPQRCWSTALDPTVRPWSL